MTISPLYHFPSGCQNRVKFGAHSTEPVPPGQHEIRLHGVIIAPAAISPTPSFETAVTYHLIVSDIGIPSTEQGSGNATNTTTTAVLTNR